MKGLGQLYTEYIPNDNRHKSTRSLFDKNTGSLSLSLKDIPFWYWDDRKHDYLYQKLNGFCCFNHIIGLPKKHGIELPLFPYEMEVYNALFNNSYANKNNDMKRYKHVWIKKATGMGITEFVIRLMIYLPLAFPDSFKNSQMAIVTGINMITAKRIMQRMKNLFYNILRINFDTNDRVITINDCVIEAYPAVNPDSYRALDNPSFFFMDEFDFFPESLSTDVMDAVERYFAKSNPYVILNSTPNKPGGLLERIEKQDEDECLYKRLFLLANKGMGYIYSDVDMELAKQSDSFAREYLGEYRGLKGNLFSVELLNYATSVISSLDIISNNNQFQRTLKHDEGELKVYDVVSNPRFSGLGYDTSIGVDPAFNSSNFAFIVTKRIQNIVYVVKELELFSPTHEEAIEVTKDLMYNYYPTYNPKVYVDSSGVSFIRSLKKEIGEPDDYHDMNQENLNESILSPNGIIVCPIPFNKYSDRMNYHLKRLFELGMIRYSTDITPALHVGLSTASYDEDKNRFDKKKMSKSDVYDACRLAMINYNIGNLKVIY